MAIFPEEVLILVFAQLQLTWPDTYWENHSAENNARRGALWSICLSSKAFHRLAQPILYHTIDLDSEPAARGSPVSSLHHPWRLQPLLRSLLNPELVKLTKRLKVEVPDSDEDYTNDAEDHEWAERDNRPDGEIVENAWWTLQAVANTVQGLKHPILPERLRQDATWGLKHGHRGAELAVLLPICTAVESLHVVSRGDMTPRLLLETIDYLGSGEGPSPKSPAIFPNLREFVIGGKDFPEPDQGNNFTFNSIEKLLYDTKLTTLKLYNLTFVSATGDPQHSYSLNEVVLHNCWTDEYDIERALDMWPNLTHLELVFDQREALRERTDLSASVDNSAGQRIGTDADFAKCGTKLEHIVWDCCSDKADEERSPFSSLPALKILQTTVDMLLGPASGNVLSPWPRSLVESVPEGLQMLSLIRIDQDLTEREFLTDFDQRVIDMCRSSKLRSLHTIRMERKLDHVALDKFSSLEWTAAKDGETVVLRRPYTP